LYCRKHRRHVSRGQSDKLWVLGVLVECGQGIRTHAVLKPLLIHGSHGAIGIHGCSGGEGIFGIGIIIGSMGSIGIMPPA
jgi:hypothetical protein